MGPTPTAFRQARSNDAGEIARLATELGYPVQCEEMQQRLSRLLPDPAHLVAVAGHRDDALSGWIHAENRFSLEGGARVEIVGLMVDRRMQRQGIGGGLMELVESWATGLGPGKITVRSNVVRKAAHPFYEARGYVREKSQHVYVKRLPARGDR